MPCRVSGRAPRLTASCMCSVAANLGAVYEDNVNGVVGLSVLETYQYLGGRSVDTSMWVTPCGCMLELGRPRA